MRDPVSGFEYPDAWTVGLNDDVRASVEAGLSVLTADGTILRRGFTTGTTAAAAAKSAVLSINHTVTEGVSIMTPAGIRIFVQATADAGYGESRKYSGDYPGDVTSGLCFCALATPCEEGIRVTTGAGIGIWSRDNPRYKKGSPAISPPAFAEIYQAIREALSETGLPGVEVCITALGGEQVAEQTLNSRIGVVGGVSVLGSTGFVEPWDDHLEDSFLQQIAGSQRVVLTTGRVGLRHSRLMFPGFDIVLVGSRLGPALAKSQGEVIICGLPALILKFINPAFLEGSGFGSVEEMLGTPEFEARTGAALSKFILEHPGVRVVLLERDGKIIREAP